MKILVPVKRTPHRDAKIEIDAEGRIDGLESLKHEANPFDELAVEAAVRIAEARSDVDVLAVTVGGESCREVLLAALAMGADRAIRVATDEGLDSLQIARTLARIVEREGVDLVLCGKLAVDDESGQVPAMLAALIDAPMANQASSIELLDAGAAAVRVECEVDTGIDVVEMELPAVVTADLRLNEPRYASLPGIMKAKRKPLEVVSLDDLGVSAVRRSEATSYSPLPSRGTAERIESASDLVAGLRRKGLIG